MSKLKQKLVLIFIISICIILQLTIKTYAVTGTISSTSIRLRKSPSTSSEILETILKGEKVEIISEEEGWYKAKYGKLYGYLSKEYVKIEETTTSTNSDTNLPDNNNQNPSTPANTQPQEDLNQQSEMNIHILPLINSTIIYQAKNQENVNILHTINNWNYVEVNSTRGWVIKEITTNSVNNTEQTSTTPTQDENITNTTQQSDNTIQNTNTTNTMQPTNTTQYNNTVQSNNNKQNNSEAEQTTKEAYISVEQVNFRKEASMEATVLDTLGQNTKVEIIGTKGEWSKIKYKQQEGYIATRYLSEQKVEVSTRSAEPRKATSQENQETEQNNTNPTKTELVEYAKKFLGAKYVHGGASPSGFDCSGFTYYVYKHFGHNLSRSSSAQANNGTYVEKTDLQLGDLIFFSHYKTFKGIGHVGIYIGNNNFIHASSEKTGVIITSLDSGNYPKRYVKAKRIF